MQNGSKFTPLLIIYRDPRNISEYLNVDSPKLSGSFKSPDRVAGLGSHTFNAVSSGGELEYTREYSVQ